MVEIDLLELEFALSGYSALPGTKLPSPEVSSAQRSSGQSAVGRPHSNPDPDPDPDSDSDSDSVWKDHRGSEPVKLLATASTSPILSTARVPYM